MFQPFDFTVSRLRASVTLRAKPEGVHVLLLGTPMLNRSKGRGLSKLESFKNLMSSSSFVACPFLFLSSVFFPYPIHYNKLVPTYFTLNIVKVIIYLFDTIDIVLSRFSSRNLSCSSLLKSIHMFRMLISIFVIF